MPSDGLAGPIIALSPGFFQQSDFFDHDPVRHSFRVVLFKQALSVLQMPAFAAEQVTAGVCGTGARVFQPSSSSPSHLPPGMPAPGAGRGLQVLR